MSEIQIASLTIDNSQAAQALTQVDVQMMKLATDANRFAAGFDASTAAMSAAGTAAAAARGQIAGLGDVTEVTTVRTRGLTAEYNRMMTGIAGTAQATERFDGLINRVNADLSAGKLTAEQHAVAVGKITERYGTLTPEMEKAARSTGRLGQIAGQAGYQIGDFATQVAGGQSALLAFTQQGSQLAGAFGPMGAVIGAVIAVAGGLAMAVSRTGDAASGASSAYDDYAKAIELAKKASGEMATASGTTLAALEAERRSILGARDALLSKVEAQALDAKATAEAMNQAGMGVAAGQYERSFTVLSEQAKKLRKETTLLRAEYGEFNDGARTAGTVTARNAGVTTAYGAKLAELNQSIKATVTQLGLEVEGHNLSNAAKLRAKLTAEALTQAGLAEAKSLPEATRGLIDQAVARQNQLDQLKEEEKQRLRGVTASLAETKAREQGLDAVQDYVGRLRDEALAVNMTDRNRAIFTAGLQAERIAKGRLTDNETAKYIAMAQEEAGALFDVKAAHDQATEAAKEYQRVVQRTTDDVVKYGADAFADMFSKNTKGWKGMLEIFEQTAEKTFARIAAEAILRPIVEPCLEEASECNPNDFGIDA